MCDPFSITAIALSISASAASYKAQADQARASGKYQNAVALQTGQIAQSNYLQQTGAAGAAVQQGQLQASSQIQANQTRGLQAQGALNTAAAEAGVGGNSVDEMLQDFRRQEALAADSIHTNQSFNTQQIISQEEGLRAQAQGRIASSRPGPISGPSAVALGLSIAGSAFSAYDGAMRRGQVGPYDPNGSLQNQGVLFRPIPFLSGFLPQRQQQSGQVFSS